LRPPGLHSETLYQKKKKKWAEVGGEEKALISTEVKRQGKSVHLHFLPWYHWGSCSMGTGNPGQVVNAVTCSVLQDLSDKYSRVL
jgi:hypothetical protein